MPQSADLMVQPFEVNAGSFPGLIAFVKSPLFVHKSTQHAQISGHIIYNLRCLQCAEMWRRRRGPLTDVEGINLRAFNKFRPYPPPPVRVLNLFPAQEPLR
jgi:hypothetical protein